MSSKTCFEGQLLAEQCYVYANQWNWLTGKPAIAAEPTCRNCPPLLTLAGVCAVTCVSPAKEHSCLQTQRSPTSHCQGRSKPSMSKFFTQLQLSPTPNRFVSSSSPDKNLCACACMHACVFDAPLLSQYIAASISTKEGRSPTHLKALLCFHITFFMPSNRGSIDTCFPRKWLKGLGTDIRAGRDMCRTNTQPKTRKRNTLGL